jgi:cell wall-associated NlpC family hydrolase
MECLLRVALEDAECSRIQLTKLEQESMKGRYCTAFCFVAITLLFTSASDYSQNAGKPTNPSAKQVRDGSHQASKLNDNINMYEVYEGDGLIQTSQFFRTIPESLTYNRLRSIITLVGMEVPAIAASDVSLQGIRDQASEPSSQPLRLRLVEAGFEWIGVRYRFGGGSQKSGFDCSGLIKSLFSKFNIELPRSSREQFKQGEKVDRDKLEAGDLVFFSSGGSFPTHVGIYVGNGKFLHSASKARRVIVSDLNKLWYTMRYLGARRIVDLSSEERDTTADDN